MEPSTSANKLIEQATAKADLSYSYWAAGRSEKSQNFTEKKLNEKEAKEEEEKARAASQNGSSVWNQAGTFEERDVTEWAKERLRGLLEGLEYCSGSALVTLKELKSTSGEAHVWLVRGKRRAGFEFTIEVDWELEDEARSGASGSLRLENVSPDELDELEDLMQITVTESGAHASTSSGRAEDVKNPVKGVACCLKAKLAELHKMLKEGNAP